MGPGGTQGAQGSFLAALGRRELPVTGFPELWPMEQMTHVRVPQSMVSTLQMVNVLQPEAEICRSCPVPVTAWV